MANDVKRALRDFRKTEQLRLFGAASYAQPDLFESHYHQREALPLAAELEPEPEPEPSPRERAQLAELFDIREDARAWRSQAQDAWARARRARSPSEAEAELDIIKEAVRSAHRLASRWEIYYPELYRMKGITEEERKQAYDAGDEARNAELRAREWGREVRAFVAKLHAGDADRLTASEIAEQPKKRAKASGPMAELGMLAHEQGKQGDRLFEYPRRWEDHPELRGELLAELEGIYERAYRNSERARAIVEALEQKRGPKVAAELEQARPVAEGLRAWTEELGESLSYRRRRWH